METLTHTDYMNRYSTLDAAERASMHRTYYAQFVSDSLRNSVVSVIGEAAILRSVDPHMNDIPLRLWDNLDHFIRPIGARINNRINGSSVWSLSDTVCVAKEAARQFKDSHNV